MFIDYVLPARTLNVQVIVHCHVPLPEGMSSQNPRCFFLLVWQSIYLKHSRYFQILTRASGLSSAKQPWPLDQEHVLHVRANLGSCLIQVAGGVNDTPHPIVLNIYYIYVCVCVKICNTPKLLKINRQARGTPFSLVPESPETRSRMPISSSWPGHVLEPSWHRPLGNHGGVGWWVEFKWPKTCSAYNSTLSLEWFKSPV